MLAVPHPVNTIYYYLPVSVAVADTSCPDGWTGVHDTCYYSSTGEISGLLIGERCRELDSQSSAVIINNRTEEITLQTVM